MIYKNLLIAQAKEISQLLTDYIEVHDQMLQSAGTFKSLFKSVDFLKIHKDIGKVKANFEKKAQELKDIKEEHYGSLADVSMDFFDALEGYFNALFEAVKQLSVLSFRLYNTSKGVIHNKQKLSWSEYSQLRKVYEEKVKGYVDLGGKLNQAYQALESEPNDFTDEDEEVKIETTESIYRENNNLFGENSVNPQIQQRKKRIQQIIDQYEKRIMFLLNGRQKEQLTESERKTYDILVRASMYDPRRPDVGFGTKEMVEKGFEIGAKLDTLSDEQFLTDPYVLEWIDTIGEGMKVNNLPIDNP